MPPRRKIRAPTTVSLARRSLPPATKSKLLRLLMLGHSPHDVSNECRCCLKTVYNYINNILMHGSIKKPLVRALGPPRRLSAADEEALFEMLVSEGWRMLDEIRFWLWCERNALVSLATISRTLKRREWNKKKLYLMGRVYEVELQQHHLPPPLSTLRKAFWNGSSKWMHGHSKEKVLEDLYGWILQHLLLFWKA